VVVGVVPCLAAPSPPCMHDVRTPTLFRPSILQRPCRLVACRSSVFCFGLTGYRWQPSAGTQCKVLYAARPCRPTLSGPHASSASIKLRSRAHTRVGPGRTHAWLKLRRACGRRRNGAASTSTSTSIAAYSWCCARLYQDRPTCYAAWRFFCCPLEEYKMEQRLPSIPQSLLAFGFGHGCFAEPRSRQQSHASGRDTAHAG
jgi:hypothetical protein